MTCTTCGEQPKKACNDFTKAVVEINNPEKLILFRRVDIPASMGDETTVPPVIGKYCNALVYYEASGNAYLYSSDGIPTKLTFPTSQGGEAVWGAISGDISDQTDLQQELSQYIKTGDYATDTDAGLVKVDTAFGVDVSEAGELKGAVISTGNYASMRDDAIVSKGTLENALDTKDYATKTYTDTANLSDEVRTILPTEIINGYWNTTGDEPVWQTSNTRLIPNEYIVAEPGDRLTFKSNSLHIGVWVKEDGASEYTNVFPYAFADPQQTIIFDKKSIVILQFKNEAGTSITPSSYNEDVTITRKGVRELDERVGEIESNTIEIEHLTKDDFVSGTITLPTNVKANSTTRLCTPFIRSAKKDDIITYLSPELQVGIWVVYAGETTPTNIVPYTQASETKTFTLPKDAIEILFQIKRVAGTTLTVDAYNCEISIIRSKLIADSDRGRFSRYECIKSVNHRGYQELAPENTLPAFRLSAEHNFEWIETDVQFTSDDVPVILHDRSINRTARNTDGSTISGTVNIDSITYAQALQYDYGIWFGPEYAGTKMPTFEEMINYCKNLGLKVRIELKNETVTTSNLPTLIDIVNKYGMIKNVEWASFELSLLQYISTNHPTFDIGYIVSTLNATAVSNAQALKTTTNNVTVAAKKDSTDANIKLLSDAMIPLDLWTITSPGEIFNANKYVSSITTNRYKASEVLYNL